MSKITFNPNNTEQLIVYLESLNSIDDLLENSALIYSSELDIKKGAWKMQLDSEVYLWMN